jgi:hypothetical protein
MVVSQDSPCHRTTSAGRCDPHGQSDKTVAKNVEGTQIN